jgi:hypothetical protein
VTDTVALGDIVELFDGVWERFTCRMAGLTDPEWTWCPTSDDRISLRWRLDHIAEFLAARRNWLWLGAAPPNTETNATMTAADALLLLTEAFTTWRALLSDSGLDLSASIGDAAGPYEGATRRSFVLHVVDELIHHTAEAALLRDLYANRIRVATQLEQD